MLIFACGFNLPLCIGWASFLRLWIENVVQINPYGLKD